MSTPDVQERLRNRIASTDVEAMSQDEFDAWLNALPPDEFCELVSLCGSTQRLEHTS